MTAEHATAHRRRPRHRRGRRARPARGLAGLADPVGLHRLSSSGWCSSWSAAHVPLAYRIDATLPGWPRRLAASSWSPTTVETAHPRPVLGKLALGLRTVRDDAGPITFQHAFVRALLGVVEIYVFSGVPAFFSALLSSKGKRLGDTPPAPTSSATACACVLPPPPMMPPQLAGGQRAPTSPPCPIGLAVAIRQFLGRVQQIEPAARQSLGARLAEQTAPYVAPAPPPGTPPEAFLAAVIAARRDRDHARLVREDELRRRLTSRP